MKQSLANRHCHPTSNDLGSKKKATVTEFFLHQILLARVHCTTVLKLIVLLSTSSNCCPTSALGDQLHGTCCPMRLCFPPQHHNDPFLALPLPSAGAVPQEPHWQYLVVAPQQAQTVRQNQRLCPE